MNAGVTFAKLGVTFQLESWESYFPEALPLWRQHYEELGDKRLPFGPDVSSYAVLDQAGALQILTARRAGAMVGYCLLIVRRHMHYDALVAIEDSYYLAPAERRGRTGLELVKRSVQAAKARGAAGVYFHSLELKPLDRLFAFLGFSRCHSVWRI